MRGGLRGGRARARSRGMAAGHVDRRAAGARGWLTCSTPTAPREAGAAFGQLASRLTSGGLLISSSRLVEINCRAAILIAPGPVPLRPHAAAGDARRAAAPARRAQACTGRPRRPRGTPTASRPSRDAPLELRGVVDLAGRPVLAWVTSSLHRPRRAARALRRQGRDHGGRRELGRRRRCSDWYERVRRPLPWRATRDPYALLVSEVMLQQTQARARRAVLRGVPGALPRRGGAGRGARRRRARGVERARLQPPRARAAARGARTSPRTAGRRT